MEHRTTRLKRLKYLAGCLHIRPGAFTTAAGLILGGAGAAAVTPALSTPNVLGNASLLIGVVVLISGTRINAQHLWKPWWRGVPSPFRVKAGLHNFDYAPGSVVSGINWQQGFSHVYLTIKNVSDETVENIDAALAPEHPIIRSSVHCDFAECHIGSLFGQPSVTTLIDYPDGTRIAESQGFDQPGNYSIDATHRLRCDRLPAGAEIHTDLATVVIEHDSGAAWFWKRERVDPEGIRIRIHWTEDRATYAIEQVLELKGLPQSNRESVQ